MSDGPDRRLEWTLVFVACCVVLATPCRAQAPDSGEGAPGGERRAVQLVRFVAGGALGLGAHESGHLVFGALFGAAPGLKRVEFAGIPFFAITHRADLSRRREFAVSSAGVWLQHATSEILLSRYPDLRGRRAPLVKGALAFDLLVSAAYAGAAFGRVGPAERDTRSMASALGVSERWIGVVVLAPALLDAFRYFHPEGRWARWSSRAVKMGAVLLVLR